MAFYFVIATLLYFLGIIEQLSSIKNRSKLVSKASVLILVIFAGFKISGGTDYNAYKFLFEEFNGFSLLSFIEPGFQLLIIPFFILSLSFTIFYFFIALINISIKGTVFYNILPCVGAAFLIYFSGCFFERDNDGIRQGLAISFCFLALKNLIDNKDIKFFIYTIVATSIHYSSVIFLITFFLNKIRWSNRTIIYIIGLAYVVYFINIQATSLLIRLIPIEMISVKLDIYSNSEFSESFGINIGIIFRTFLLILFISLRNKIRINESTFLIMRNGFALSIILFLIFNNFGILSHRLPYVFREFQIFIIAYIIGSLANKGSRIIGLTIVYAYTCLILYRFFGEGSVYNNYSNLLFL